MPTSYDQQHLVAAGGGQISAVKLPSLGVTRFGGSRTETVVADENVTRSLRPLRQVGVPAYTHLPPRPTPYSLSGTVRNASGAYVARKVRALSRASGALVGEATSDGATGAFSIPVPSNDPHTVVVFDADAGEENALVFDRVIPL